MSTIEKANISCIIDYNGKHYLKNIINGCTIELDKQYYDDFKYNKEYVLKELDSLGFFNIRKDNSISLMIMLSSGCNLNCSYCFEKNKKDFKIQYQTMEYISAILKNNIAQSTDFVDITFTGGEPLLAPTEMIQITNTIKSLCNELKVPVYFSVITNGILFDEEILNFFNENCFSIQITFDGNRESHDHTRYFNDYSGSFDIIMKNLSIIYSKYDNIRVRIRVNISSNAFDNYSELFRYLFETYPKFDVYIDFLDVPYTSEFYIQDDEKIEFFYNFLLLLKEYRRIDIINYFEGGNCMIRNKNSFTIDSNGDIYKCYSLVGDKKYLQGSVRNFINAPISTLIPMIDSCNQTNCIFRLLCYGGCPYKNLVQNKKLDCICKYEFIKKMNSFIFVTDIVSYEDIYEIKGLVDNVKYFQIDFN